MPQLGTDNINLKDGRTLTEVLEGLGTGGNSTPVDLKDYAKAEYVDSKIQEIKASIPVVDLTVYDTTKDVDNKIANVVASLNQVITDLKAGVYNSVASTVVTEEVKASK